MSDYDPSPADPSPADPRRTTSAGRRELHEDVEELGEQIARLAAHIQAATYRLLVMIRAFDEAEGWHHQGFTSCARWLAWRTGIGPGAAREKVRVARALGDLPELSAALETADLSYSVARALTRVATPENEADLVEVARHSTAAQMERLVSAWRATDRAEDAGRERKRHRSRELTVVPDAADGSYVVRGRLDPEAGAALSRALEAAGEEIYGEEGEPDEEEAHRPRAARRADALGRVAEAALGGGLGESARTADRYQVVVHVSAETLAGARDGDGSAETADGATSKDPPSIEGGPPVSAETARRLGCDAGAVGMLHGDDGSVLSVGRKSRTVPTPLRRALEHRDGGCRFPGCGSRLTDAHHLVPWAEGGETSLENLVLLCRRHHRRVHEGGWRIERRGDGAEEEEGELVFLRPDGWELPRRPPAAPVPDLPLCRLEREHEELEIDVRTGLPRWMGEALDLDWTLWVLRRPEGPPVSAETSEAGVPAAPDDAGRPLDT